MNKLDAPRWKVLDEEHKKKKNFNPEAPTQKFWTNAQFIMEQLVDEGMNLVGLHSAAWLSLTFLFAP